VGRLVVAGAAPAKKPSPGAPELDYVAMGGHAMGKANGASSVAILFDLADLRGDPAVAAAEFAMGVQLRAYQFDLYKTKKKDEDDKPKVVKVTIGVADPKAVRRAMGHATALADGVKLARSLVNEPPNVLFPIEFAKRASELSKLGVEIEVLDVKAMAKLGMNALLGVGQGSTHESRLVIMRWNGGKKNAAPVAFIGKGVTFDSGGISIKPGGGMEDMKGDMAGAACVTGLMHALAAKAVEVAAMHHAHRQFAQARQRVDIGRRVRVVGVVDERAVVDRIA
jgi:leucyl aminopeptidase